MAESRIVTGMRRDGEEFPIDAAISHLRDGDHVFYTVILRDVSAREKALADLAVEAASSRSWSPPRKPRASRRRAASRASCTTSSGRRSR
jgi:hypothetical protein